MTTDKIPTIYASIGDREDVNTHPNARTAVEAALGEKYFDPQKQIAHLELALREALSRQFLADSLREWAENSPLAHGYVAGGLGEVIKDIADDICKKSL